MFKFTRLFSLEHDIVPRIPLDQLPPEAKSFIDQNANAIGMAMGVPQLQGSSSNINSVGGGSSNGIPTGLSNNNGNGGGNNSTYSTSSSNISRSIPNNMMMNSGGNVGNNGSGYLSSSMQKTLPPINFNTPPNQRTSLKSMNQFKLGSSFSNVIPHYNGGSPIQQQQYQQDSPHSSSSSIRFSASSTIMEEDEDEDDDMVMMDDTSDIYDLNQSGLSRHDINNINLLNLYNQKNIAQMINLRVIGRDGKTLIIARTARIDSITKTCIDLYELNTKKYQNILDFSGNIINATLDNKRSFLVFTVLMENGLNETNNNSIKYSSFIYEMNKKNNIFHPLETSSTPLYYHCLHLEPKYLHLLLFQNDECSTIRVQIQTDEKIGGHLPPKKRIDFKKNLITNKKFFWYQYDDINHVLYCLQYVKLRSLQSPSENLLKKYIFKDGKVSSSGEFTVFLNITTDKVSPNSPYPLQQALTKPDQVFQNIHIVQLDNNGICLCHQEESNNTSIKISIYFIHLKQKLRYSIPLNIEGGVLSIQVTRVLFDSIGSYLMVYIPGHFLQFIDCAAQAEHDPCFGLTFYHNLSCNISELSSHDSSDIVSVRTRPLPTKLSTSIIPYYVKNEQNLLFDYNYGILYKYQFDRESISNLFEKESIVKYGLDYGAELRALHLVMIHMQDNELVYKILVKISNEPQLITSELLKEYILGQTYIELKNNKLDHQYLQVLPMTCSETMDISSLRTKLKDIDLSAINYMQVPTCFFVPKELKKRLKSFEVLKQEGAHRETHSVVSSFIKNFFGVDDVSRSEETQSNSSYSLTSSFYTYGGGGRDGSRDGSRGGPLSPNGKSQPLNSKIALKHSLEDYEEDPLYDIHNYTSNLADHWHQISQKESRDKLIEWSNSYRNVQINTVNTLYNILIKHIGGGIDISMISIGNYPKKSQLFRVLEKLYIAIEELSCPFPKGFFTTFTILGFYCLPRKVFLQYLQKGLFVVTSSFIDELKKYYNTELGIVLTVEDRNFINQVILYLRDQSKMLENMHKWPLNTQYILDHLISNLIQKGEDPKSDVDAMGLDFSNSSFIPLSSLFIHLDRCINQQPNTNQNNSNSNSGNYNQKGSSNSSSAISTPTTPIKMLLNNNSFSTPPSSPISISPPKLQTPPKSQIQPQFHQSSTNLSNDHLNLHFIKYHYERSFQDLLIEQEKVGPNPNQSNSTNQS